MSGQVANNHKTVFVGAKLLIIDDDKQSRECIAGSLNTYDFELAFADSCEAAISALEHFSADIVITESLIGNVSGIEILEHIHRNNPVTPVIILTAHGSISDAIAATQAGAFTYLTKPLDTQELTDSVVSSLYSVGFNTHTLNEQQVRLDPPEGLTYKSAAMTALIKQANRYAVTNDLLIIEGEPGTHKDQLAHMLHSMSHRNQGPVVQISCAGMLPTRLYEEVRGVIGQGDEDNPERPSLLLKAHTGTVIFSDYEEAKDHYIQQLLEAVIEQRVSYPDSNQDHHLDVRVIATTNVRAGSNQRKPKILTMAQQLNATVLKVPRLGQRREDIPLIINDYLSNQLDRPDLQFSAQAMRTLLQAKWPGNTRQLMNVVQQCVRLTTTKVISDTLVKSRLNSPLHETQPLSKAQRDFERNYLTKVLKLTNGNVTKASEIAKRNRTEFHRLLKKHRIQAQSFRSN